MNAPTITTTRNVAQGVDQLGTYVPVPGFGTFAVNAFLLRSKEPVLVDCGISAMHEPMLAAVEALINPTDLRWIYMTHMDADHVGCLDALLAKAPQARIVTTFIGMAKLSFSRMIPPNRFFLLNPGQELDVGDRKLLAATPPCFDAPETTILFDPTARTLFSSDYFGALLPSPIERADQVPADGLRQGQGAWLAVDSPWLRNVQPSALEQGARAVAELRPETVLSTHLAPAKGSLVDAMTANVLAAPGGPPFPSPDQKALEAMLAGMK